MNPLLYQPSYAAVGTACEDTKPARGGKGEAVRGGKNGPGGRFDHLWLDGDRFGGREGGSVLIAVPAEPSPRRDRPSSCFLVIVGFE
jgi:hypothetical protein